MTWAAARVRAGEAGEGASQDLARAALEALREELETDPKPGLVTPSDRGSHRDMDATTFRASLEALRTPFERAASAGRDGAPFATLRALGIDAERRMLAATGGVNTHRGAIFTLGLLAAAAGRLHAAGQALSPGALRSTVRSRWGGGLLRELPPDPYSHGTAVARRYGAGGARAEAAGGFPHLFDVALPALWEARRWRVGRRAAAVQCLMAVMAELPDTNLLHRGGPAGLGLARRGARAFVAGGGVRRTGWEEEVRALHRRLVARRLSPGGCADLLAAALFVERITVEGEPG